MFVLFLVRLISSRILYSTKKYMVYSILLKPCIFNIYSYFLLDK